MKLLTIISILSFAFQQPDSVLTEKDVVAMALKHNFDIQLETYNVDLANSNNTIGNAGMLPVVDLSGNARQSVQNTEQEFISGETQQRDGAKTTNYSAGANLEWTLFDGLKMFATKERLAEMTQMNQFALEEQIQNSLADVMKAFYNTALEQERLALLKSALDVSAERVSISKDKYEVGKASKLEYLQAQVDYNTDQSAYVRQKEVIARRKLELLQLIGTADIQTDFSLVFDFESYGRLMDLESLEPNAVSQNLQLQYLKSQQEVNLLTIKESERERYPSLDFNLGYNYSNLSAEAGFLRSNVSTGLTYGLTATMTVFDGLNQSRAIQNAKIRSEQSWTAYQKAETQLRTSVRSGILTLKNAQTLVNLEKSNLAVANENVEIALERYRIGKSNPLEIREAQNNAVNAQIRFIEAMNTAKLAEIELLRLSGMLTD